ncbi:MAG TPA: RteC domain-containing protein [Puia sp.]|nr:RteC domain-containing protein [Puia sp.]
MHDQTKQQLRELHDQFHVLDISDSLTDLTTGDAPLRVSECIDGFTELLNTHVFSSDQDEIVFFKTTFPPLIAASVFSGEKLHLEALQEEDRPEAIADYFCQELRRMNKFFRKHARFIRYYVSNRSDRDREYFLRAGSANQEPIDLAKTLYRPGAPVNYSIAAGFLIAYCWLADLIERWLLSAAGHSHIHDRSMAVNASPADEDDLRWTDSGADLVELIYALQAKGAFNHGEASIRKIVRAFQRAFHFALSNPSRTFQEILSRKNGRTRYLDKLKKKLDDRCDEIDEGNA